MGAAALLLRLLLLALVPHVPAADGAAYHRYAAGIAAGTGYVNLDGSPGIRWMPGWPYALAALYAVFGAHASVGMLANAVFDAVAAGALVCLGAGLLDARTGRIAGLLYALWPGMIAYAATLFTEPLFNACLVGALALLVRATRRSPVRAADFALAGLPFGAAALVKSEPLLLAPVVAAYLARVLPDRRAFARAAAAFAAVVGLALAPWIARNWILFDRFLPVSASGGIGAHLANRPGASGGQDIAANRELQRRYRGATSAETSLNRHDAGWSDAWAFASAHPGEQARIVASKFRITYGGDDQALRTIRGPLAGPRARLAPAAFSALSALANLWWLAALGLALVGIPRLLRGPPGAGVLVLGPLLVWWGLHVLVLAGERYHVPEIPFYALLAALGLQALADAARRRLRRPA